MGGGSRSLADGRCVGNEGARRTNAGPRRVMRDSQRPSVWLYVLEHDVIELDVSCDRVMHDFETVRRVEAVRPPRSGASWLALGVRASLNTNVLLASKLRGPICQARVRVTASLRISLAALSARPPSLDFTPLLVLGPLLYTSLRHSRMIAAMGDGRNVGSTQRLRSS